MTDQLAPVPTPSPLLSGGTVGRRSFLRGALGGAAALGTGSLLAACGSNSSGGSGGTGGNAGGNPATVRLWTWYGEQRDEWPKLIEKFQSANPNIKVDNWLFGNPDQYLPALQAAVSAGDVPELFAPHTRALSYGTGGISADLKSDMADVLGDVFDSANQEYTLDGKQYAIGWMAQTFGLFYNPDLMARAKVDPESLGTWDGLVAAAPKFKAAGTYGVSISCNPGTSAMDFFLPLITQVADDPTFFLKLDQAQDGLTWEDPKVVAALELQKRIVDSGIFQPGATGTSGDQAPQIFYTEKSAMLFNGSWSPQGFVQNASKAFVSKYKVMKNPALTAGGKHWTANQAGAGLAVSETSKNKDAAITFLKFLYDKANYSPTMNSSNSMPATKSAAASIDNAVMKQMTSWLIDGEGCPHIPFGNGTVAAADPLVQVFEGKGTPADIAKQMQAAVVNARG